MRKANCDIQCEISGTHLIPNGTLMFGPSELCVAVRFGVPYFLIFSKETKPQPTDAIP